ncbi:mercuric transport protein MerTP [Rufibacter sp. LB8]|uniref:mercuric transport protein MerTP n=1 Tax=Rufibacter sp. LB8 TaxID=2777781 RepID=UPI00178C5FA1|nr:mercuric transport protein MerTP [Rufibacter sp. LB8]
MKQKRVSLRSQDASEGKVWLGTGLLAALAASMCCITPLLALVAGTSGVAASFSWLEPLRPFLIGLTILVLGFAWYKNLNPAVKPDCDCDLTSKPKFMQTKLFLSIITMFAVAMLAFPSYAHVFYSQAPVQQVGAKKGSVQAVELKITGMTCSACEGHVNGEVNKLKGIQKVETSYANGNTTVWFDKTITDVKQIENAVKATGYKVTAINKK